jgi:long-chain acyl-CoA synthetase
METVVDLLRDATQRYDRRPALLIRPGFRTRRWRFRDLADQVPRVAGLLRDAGIGPGDRVIVWAVNRPEWGIAALAALWAGGVVVPLDVRSLPDLAAKVTDRTAARLVLASEQTAAQARELHLPVMLIEQLPDRARDHDPLQPATLAPDSLAEIVFTSGTTGEPKGVMLSHGNLASNARALIEVFRFRRDERLLSVLPLSHMFEQTCGFLAPLAAGVSVVYPVSRQPAVLIRTFRDFRATMLLIVPQGLKLLDKAIERKVDQTGRREMFERLHRWSQRLPAVGRRTARRLLFRPVLSQFGGRLRTVAVGGAAMDPALAGRWSEMGIDVLQGYGTTEMSPVISFTPAQHNRVGTVGLAVPGVEVRVADDGEVVVRGPNRFTGYWENPGATAAVVDSAGWYHTGDLGTLDADGFLTLHGRKKDMLVLPDGTNVYPEDIEAVLTRDPRVRDATVVGLQRPGEDFTVHAVLLLEDPADEDAVIRDANALLSGSQQIRSHSIWDSDDFPRTHTLKVVRREVLAHLMADATGLAVSAAASRVPGTSIVRRPSGNDTLANLTGLVASVSGVPPDLVRPDARLQGDLGLDSLGRVELLSVIEEEMGAYVDDGTLDPEATVAELAALIDANRGSTRDEGIYGWPLNPVVRAVGIGLQELLVVPFVFLFYRVRIRGEEHLRGLEGPVIFAPNHCLHSDNAIILTSIPLVWRWRLSVAAAADDIFGHPWRALGAAVLGNAFPLAREGAIRRSLELLGARLDRDFSVLIYPEGKLTVGGPMQPFKSGTGLIAVEGGTPVVPMKIRIRRISWIDARRPGTSPRGDVEVVYGAPIRFDADANFAEATSALEAAVAAL